MADVSKFKVPIKSGNSTSLTEYEVKDSTARSGLVNKVDKVTGKGLSTNDYTTAEKNKLAGIASGAEVNVQSDWSQTTNTADDFIKNKPTLGTAAAKDVASTGNASTTQVVMGNDTRLTDARTPTSHTHTKSQITDFPTLGTAAAKNVASSGNASSTQVVMGNDTRLSDSRPASDVSAWAKASTKPSYTASEVGAIATIAKGANNGVAELDSSGKVPSAQLPSFVDDVIEGYYYNNKFYKESAHTTEITGESGKIYVDLSTDKTYRWGGSSYVVISETLALGETSTTAYRGDRGKTAYDHSQTTHARTDATAVAASTTNGNIKINGTETTVYTHPGSGTNPHGTTKTDVGLGNVGNFKAVSTVASQGLTDTEKSNARTNIGAGTSSFSGSYSDLTNTPPLVKGGGYGGNTIGGTGVNTNTTRYANSVAYGNSAVATANYAFAFGDNATAGNYNRSTGKHAVAIGNNVSAEKDYEIAYGKFNQSNADTAFSIGNGTSSSDRHNLMELKTDGTLLLNGNAVKTEGGDDNKLRLGQIWGMRMSGNASRSPKYGFSDLFESSPTIYTITFQANYSSIDYDLKVYQFGDFVGSISSSTVTVQPLLGRKVDYPTTGKWIKVENCYHMFTNCTLIQNFDLSMFDTSEVENMNNMFAGCAYGSFKSLDLSMIDTSKVKDMTRMFYGCTHLKTLDISSFDMTNVTAYDKMFGEASHWAGITTLKCPKINPHDDIPLPRKLYSQDGTAYTNLPVTTGTSIELRQSWT